MKLNLKIWIVSILIAGMALASCDSYFDVETDDILDVSDNYKERETIYAGLLGIADVFRAAVEHNIILSELQGDLMKPTSNAPDECWDIYRLKATPGNSFASPQPFYRLIVECNEFLKNTISYNKSYPGSLVTNVYNGLISSALTYRVWAYLQIGKLYGEAVYHDYSFVDDNGIIPNSDNILKLEQLIPELIYNLRVGVDGVNGFQKLDWKIIIDPLGKTFDQTWNHIAVDANVLLTELYLWDGDHTNAVKTGLNYLNSTDENKYKLTVFGINSDGNFTWGDLFKRDNLGDAHLNEVCTLIPYDFDRQQRSKMQYYFSNTPPNVFYFEPHVKARKRFNKQVSGVVESEDPEEDGKLIRLSDPRWMSSIDSESRPSVISKYHLGKKNFEQDAPVYVYRAAEIFLMIAEGLSGLGNIAAADSLINVGFAPSWKTGYFAPPFDAPIYTSVLNKSKGIRGRFDNKIGIKGDYVRYHLDTIVFPDSTDMLKELRQKREKFIMDSLICEETALELAYEGKRWFTLMRISKNSGNYELLAKQIAAKFDDGERQLYEKWLMDPNNWYIKWDQMNVLNQEEK